MLASGNDFYSNPRISQDGARLAWITWNHPNMPWDDTELWVADVSADGSLSGQKKVPLYFPTNLPQEHRHMWLYRAQGRGRKNTSQLTEA